MNKRIISLCLALVLLLCLLPAAPTAAAAGDVVINETNFPDDIFRSYVSETFDQNGDGVLSPDEIENAISIECSWKGISSLKGIEYFTAIKTLYCGHNQLTALDLSNNTQLIWFECGNNQLTALDVSQNPALFELSCYDNQLKSLDVSKNTALEWLSCDNNQLTVLNLSKNTALDRLYCGGNQLTALDVSKNTALKYLYCYENQLTLLDVSKNTALETLSCGGNRLTSLDVSKNTALETLYCSGNRLTALDVSKNPELNDLYCNDNQLTLLDVSKNTALYRLYCGGNQLTALDVSKNMALDYLYCENNQLTALDVSKNTGLYLLYCYGNQLTTLDVSNNPQLIWLSCYGNQLTALDVSKNTALSLLYCYGNQLTVLDLSAVPKLLDALENGMKSVRSKDNVVRYMVHNGEYDFITGEELYDEIEMDLNQKTIPASNPFLDVTADDYFNDAVSWAYQNGVASGTSKSKFSPYKTCTREQVVTFLWRAYGCQEPETTVIPFTDVPADAYYAKAVLWAVENGITNGKSKTKFGVGDPCTREQVVTFLWRAEGEPEHEPVENPFTDVSETAYSYDAILWAVEKGITKGTSKTRFSPAKTCTRGQVVTFLYRDVVGEQ